MKFATDRPFADPDQAARKLLELANAAEADRDRRIAIELINLPLRPTATILKKAAQLGISIKRQKAAP
jgi:hypothetical protein